QRDLRLEREGSSGSKSAAALTVNRAALRRWSPGQTAGHFLLLDARQTIHERPPGCKRILNAPPGGSSGRQGDAFKRTKVDAFRGTERRAKHSSPTGACACGLRYVQGSVCSSGPASSRRCFSGASTPEGRQNRRGPDTA